MSAPEVSGDNHSLATKCLDICQALSSQGKEFSFSLNFSLNSSFTFTLDTREKDTPSTSTTKARKKVSPSTQRRNDKRKAEFIKKKQDSQETVTITNLENSSLVENSFKCHLCEKSFNTEPGLKIHKGKAHKGSDPPPEHLRDTPESSSLKVSPAKEAPREEQCVCCGDVMSPDHQCTGDQQSEDKKCILCGGEPSDDIWRTVSNDCPDCLEWHCIRCCPA